VRRDGRSFVGFGRYGNQSRRTIMVCDGWDSGLSGRGRGDDASAGEVAHRWRALVMMSRLMPREAGRRWLAEAESLLAEVTPARRGAAVRSYLLSAPRLAVMMWARQVRRRAQPGPRRPG
jgi:hypothetical protein